MKLNIRDPFTIAIGILIILSIALMAYLTAAGVRRSATPWVPPGWTSPTSPPPSTK